MSLYTGYLIYHSSSNEMIAIAREYKLIADNRFAVNNFQSELAQQVSSLCRMVTGSISQQNDHIECVDKLCHSFLESHEKVLLDFNLQELLMFIWLSILCFVSFVSNDLKYLLVGYGRY